MIGVHGGVKFYRGSPGAARSYVEADHSRADDYYLAEGTGLAEHLTVTTVGGYGLVNEGGTLDGDAYEQWVAGYDTDGSAKGRLRTDENGLRFVEVVVNGPKTWSLAAAVHPEIADAYDAAQDSAAREIVAWLAENSTTRVGPRGRQVQVPVEQLEAAAVRHHTSRAGDPHRHLHLQINARVYAAGAWRGLHSVGVVDSIEAINGIGHAAVATHPAFRQALADHGYTLDPDTAEVVELQPYVGAFSARAAQIARHVDTYEAQWRTDNPGTEPGPGLRRSWDRRAWATARPDKVVPTDGEQLRRRWLDELTDAGFTPPTPGSATVEQEVRSESVAGIDRDAVVYLVVQRLSGRRSAWNSADIRGEVEKSLPTFGLVLDPAVRRELAEDLTARGAAACVPLLDRDDVPGHIRHFSSHQVLEVEADLVTRLADRSKRAGLSLHPHAPDIDQAQVRAAARRNTRQEGNPPKNGRIGLVLDLGPGLDEQQRTVAGALAGTHQLLVIEGAAGAGKTTTLATARALIEADHRRLVVVTPTLKAAQVAGRELGTDAFSASWLVHQHGYRWDDDHHWTRTTADPTPQARLRAGDVLLVDEAGMLDQDTARALLTIADETHAQVALVGDRHQLPAVGRGGVLDHAARWVPPTALLELDTVHRFTDPDYSALSLQMRTGERAGDVFDTLLARGDIVIHASDVERLHHLATLAAALTPNTAPLVIADTREQVRALNSAIRDHHRSATSHNSTAGHEPNPAGGPEFLTAGGEQISVGDSVTTRRNDHDLAVTNRDHWTVTAINPDGIAVAGRPGNRSLPTSYALQHVELAYATTVHGAQGETVDTAHLLLSDTTGAASAYVAMTRGRHHNTAHLVADTEAEARAQWTHTFTRDRADLGPTHAAHRAADDIDRYGTHASTAKKPSANRPGSDARKSPSR